MGSRILSLLAALGLVAVLVGCSQAPETVTAKPDGVVSVQVLKVQAEPVRRQVEIVGTLAGNQEVTVSSEVAGRVKAVRADLGDRVPQGAVLFELDATEHELAVERQRAALAEALAQLGVKEEGQSLPEVTETSIVRRAAAESAEAQANFERAKALQEEGVLSQQAYDSAEARARTSQANYMAALEQARNLAARVENLRAQLALARKSLADTQVRAPFTGTVRERLVEVGQYVREQTPLVALASTNPLKLRADVPERFFPYVRVGAEVEVSVEAYPGEKFAGSITRLAGAVDPGTRTFPVEARVDNSAGRLRPGLFARAVLETSKVDSAIRIPAGAALSFYGVQKVYAVERGVIREKVVKLGDRYGDAIEITEGLKPGDQIALTELARLREGTAVSVQSPAKGGTQ